MPVGTETGINLILQALVIALACYGLLVALGGVVGRWWGPGRGKKPFISILAITRNDEGAIEGIVRWLLNVDYRDRHGTPRFELVVVDDASIDQTPAILERLARETPLLRVIRVREGESAYERGLAACRGEVVCLTDLQRRKTSQALGQVVTGLFG